MVGSENKAVTWETVCSNYHYCGHVFIVAVNLGLDTLRRTSRKALRNMSLITRHYRCEFPSIATTCTIKNLASIMSIVLKDVSPPPCHLNRSEDLNSQTSSEEEKQEGPSPKDPKKPTEKNEKKTTNKQRRNGGHLEPPCEDPVSHVGLQSHGMRHQMLS